MNNIAVDFWLVGIIGFYAIWLYILFWVEKDAHEREIPQRERWTTLVFFTGPIGLGIYLLSQGQSKQRCPHCGKKLKNLDFAVCPHCNQKLTPDAMGHAFVEQMRIFDDTKFRITARF